MESRRTKSKGKSKAKWLIIILIVLLVIAGILFGMKVLNTGTLESTNEQQIEEKEPEKKLKIVDVNSKSRPVAVMINNNHAAWPQCGLQDAYLVYEIITEGGITRMMAIFKDADTAKVGSIRSARHYFLDYAQENDAIFVHWGGSERAYSEIRTRGIDDIDGIALEGSVFFRDKTLKRDLEHTGFTDLKNINEHAQKKGFTRDTKKDLLLNYSIDEIDLSTNETAILANSVSVKYSDYHTTNYEYDEESKVYKRSMSGTKNVDLVTGEQYTAKNIIAYKVSNYSFDSYGRQDLENVGSGTGYYITDGYAMPITWEKKSHSDQTVYKYENGEEITLNDGNTFIQICPNNGSINISE